jgi:hypothetical protein
LEEFYSLLEQIIALIEGCSSDGNCDVFLDLSRERQKSFTLQEAMQQFRDDIKKIILERSIDFRNYDSKLRNIKAKIVQRNINKSAVGPGQVPIQDASELTRELQQMSGLIDWLRGSSISEAGPL